jgi:lysophospholipase L1-like esterase
VHFLALGDSYTIGEAVGERERWPEQLAARLRERGLAVEPVEIVARTGWTTEELAAAVDAARLGERYDLVTLLVGVNDQYRGQALEAYRARFRRLLAGAIARAGGDPKRVVVVSIPDWGVTPFAAGRDRAAVGAAIDAFNRVNRAEARRAGARRVDVTAISREAAREPTLLAPDGLHPSGAMYRRWVDRLLPQVLSALGVSPR